MEFSSAVNRNEEGFYRLPQQCPQDHHQGNKVRGRIVKLKIPHCANVKEATADQGGRSGLVGA